LSSVPVNGQRESTIWNVEYPAHTTEATTKRPDNGACTGVSALHHGFGESAPPAGRSRGRGAAHAFASRRSTPPHHPSVAYATIIAYSRLDRYLVADQGKRMTMHSATLAINEA